MSEITWQNHGALTDALMTYHSAKRHLERVARPEIAAKVRETLLDCDTKGVPQRIIVDFTRSDDPDVTLYSEEGNVTVVEFEDIIYLRLVWIFPLIETVYGKYADIGLNVLNQKEK